MIIDSYYPRSFRSLLNEIKIFLWQFWSSGESERSEWFVLWKSKFVWHPSKSLHTEKTYSTILVMTFKTWSCLYHEPYRNRTPVSNQTLSIDSIFYLLISTQPWLLNLHPLSCKTRYCVVSFICFNICSQRITKHDIRFFALTCHLLS